MRLSQTVLAISGTALLIFLSFGLRTRSVRGQQAPSQQSGAQRAGQARSAPPSSRDKGQIERGRYLVENVAMCGECHTPRDDHGNLRTDAWLQGGPVWIQPVHPTPNWADHVPALAGLPGLTQVEVERVLEQGIGPEGETIRPPMHIYHMAPADAKAIIAYLNSLPRPLH